MRLEDLTRGSTISGLISAGDVTIVAVARAGPDASVITYRDANRKLDDCVVYRSDEVSQGCDSRETTFRCGWCGFSSCC